RVREEAAIAERARPEFHPPLKPSDDRPARYHPRDAGQQFFIRQRLEFQTGFEQSLGAFLIAEARAPVSVVHLEDASIFQNGVVRQKSRAERTARVAGHWLNEDPLERGFIDDPSIHHRIERDAARQAQVLFRGLFMQPFEQIEYDVFQCLLRAGRDVLVTFIYRFAGMPRRAQGFEYLVAELIALGKVMI